MSEVYAPPTSTPVTMLTTFEFSFGELFLLNSQPIVLSEERKVKVKTTQSCLTLQPHGLYKSMGIVHARTLEWVAVLFSRGSFHPGKIEPRLNQD